MCFSHQTVFCLFVLYVKNCLCSNKEIYLVSPGIKMLLFLFNLLLLHLKINFKV